MPPVSIVLTELNEAAEIARAVESLLAQEPPAAEVVVVDGGSTDGTWEYLSAKSAADPRLIAIRDESCSLKHSDGPVSRGRNAAIQAAKGEIVACADAGCAYAPDWLRNLTAPIADGTSEYALGGSLLDSDSPTPWDVASAPYFSVKLDPLEPTRSCTARSMAFTRALWQRLGGFPEEVLVGEDTLFDLRARAASAPAYVSNAKALYRPQNTYRFACHQMARYAMSDGMARVRLPRLARNAARCLLELAALVSLQWTVAPLVAVLAIEGWYAFGKDFAQVARFGRNAILARLAFSISVPWVVAFNHALGLIRRERQTNWQNQGNRE
ncbi:MAG: glycosyltransferase [Terracidiphilus sp.]|nr:glycosyltransferase [Terracidiphilus sp.]